MNIRHTIITLTTILVIIFQLSLSSCSKQPSNALIGKWESTDEVQRMLKFQEYTPTKIEFKQNTMVINEKEIPIIYKKKKDRQILFSRGEKIVVYLLDNGQISFHLRNIGQKIYMKK